MRSIMNTNIRNMNPRFI
jgi:hypothetical protein